MSSVLGANDLTIGSYGINNYGLKGASVNSYYTSIPVANGSATRWLSGYSSSDNIPFITRVVTSRNISSTTAVTSTVTSTRGSTFTFQWYYENPAQGDYNFICNMKTSKSGTTYALTAGKSFKINTTYQNIRTERSSYVPSSGYTVQIDLIVFELG